MDGESGELTVRCGRREESMQTRRSNGWRKFRDAGRFVWVYRDAH